MWQGDARKKFEGKGRGCRDLESGQKGDFTKLGSLANWTVEIVAPFEKFFFGESFEKGLDFLI